ncbi:hypothetical protein TKWG_00780 [Advenella kashmirensis WT001]|uniref:Hypervirulence associated protein TUDOR domain-containing protein n=1 Tax=Advenella kashmirensis (strain DSM 17095 / LMG 22695 / WT001) TaxID=1036672 RepID=I3U771_ADVKW|nr:hypothetical protein TKWG_00780 [Advenella kashmirensis WT001]
MTAKFKKGDHVSWNSEAGRFPARSLLFIQATSITRGTSIVLRKTNPNTKLKATKLITLLHIKVAHCGISSEIHISNVSGLYRSV